MTFAADAPQRASTRPRRPLWTSAWLLVLVLVLVGFGFVASRTDAHPAVGPQQPGVSAAQHAVESMLNPGTSGQAPAHLPADFTAVTGTAVAQQQAKDGTIRTVNPAGGCSAPWGEDNTKWDFAVPCKAHDLGYDLLRYSEKKGQPLPPPIRKALDDRLSTDMHATCQITPMDSPTSCNVTAEVYSAGLVTNSWHQRWGPPVSESLGPMLAGVAVIGFLLAFRLRGWLHVRRYMPARHLAAARAPLTPARAQAGRWAVLGVTSMALLVLGESAIALGRWAGAEPAWLWPLTWLAQLAAVFFFAGGHANATGWREVLEAGGGYRQYLAHRASWLLRPTLIFVVVAIALPLALELLGIPRATIDTVTRIALHPLWLLGVYLLTVVATPPMLALHQRLGRHRASLGWLPVGGLAGLVVLSEWSSSWFDAPLLRYVAVFALALFAQQVAFLHTSYGLARPRVLATAGLSAAASLAGLHASGAVPANLLGTPGSAPALAAPAIPVLLLAVLQLTALGLAAKPLVRLARGQRVARMTRFVLRAPMSLYLGFLAAMLVLVGWVYVPGPAVDALGWFTRPESLIALALLAIPAAAVFWWFERHHVGHPTPQARQGHTASRFDMWLGRVALVLGVLGASVGVFGFALTKLTGDGIHVLGLPMEPVQSLLHLVLGVFLLHALRTGAATASSTWALTALACAPPMLDATHAETIESTGFVVHGVIALFALGATVVTMWERRSNARGMVEKTA